MNKKVEFFFDIASPYSYLAATQLAGLEQLATVEWRPFLIGGVFKAANNVMPAANPYKGQYMLQDLQRLAAYYRVDFRFPSNFPTNSLAVMRALTAAAPADLPALALKAFRAYWVDDQNMADVTVLTQLLGAELMAKTADEAVKNQLKENTENAAARGAFGAPTFFYGNEMYFGEDRIFLLEHALKSS